MIRVIHVSNDFAPLSGGISTHLKNLLPAQAKVGAEPFLLVPTPTEKKEREIGEDHGYSDSGFRVVRSPFRKASNSINSLIRITQATKEGLEWLEKEYGAADLVHQHDSRATRLGATQYARKNARPMVWTNHASGFFGKSDFSARILTHIPGIHPDGLVVVHKDLEEAFFDAWGEIPVRYIPNGVDMELFTPAAGSKKGNEDTVVLFPQRMIPEKGTEELAKAAEILMSDPEGPKYRDERTIRNVKRRLERFELRGRVAYLDNPPYEAMAKHYQQSDIVVLPLKIETENISVFEAWASGTPLLVTRHMSTSGYLEDEMNCLMAESCDPETLAQEIRRLTADTGLQQKLAQNGLELAREKFTWERAANETIRFYKKILNRREV
jgi:glycosyltransferase involved in cell wall biosynthesis